MNVKKFLSLSTAVAALAVIGSASAYAQGLNASFTSSALSYGTDGSGNFSIWGTGTVDINTVVTTGVTFTLTAPYNGAVTVDHNFAGSGLTAATADFGATSVTITKGGTLIAGGSTTGSVLSVDTSADFTFGGAETITVPAGLKDANITASSLTVDDPTQINDRGDGKFTTFTGTGNFTFTANPVPEFSSVLGMGSLLVGGGLLGLRRRNRKA